MSTVTSSTPSLGRQSAQERASFGKAARRESPLESHAEFRRPDQVEPLTVAANLELTDEDLATIAAG